MPYQRTIPHYFFFPKLVDEMKTPIQKVIFGFENDTYLTDQVKWELLKYKIRKFVINFSKELARNFHRLQRNLETKIKNLHHNITNENKFNEYKSKFEVNAIGMNTVKNLLNIFQIWKNKKQ